MLTQTDQAPDRAPSRRAAGGSLGAALGELVSASGADAVVWFEPSVVAGDLWWSRVFAVGDAELVAAARALRGVRVGSSDHGGAVAPGDDETAPMAAPPWLTTLRDDRFRPLDADVVPRLIGAPAQTNGGPPTPALTELVGDVRFAAWFTGSMVSGVVALMKRARGGRFSRSLLDRAATALAGRACRRAASEGANPAQDLDRPMHAITDTDGRLEGFADGAWDWTSTAERELVAELAASFHATGQAQDTVVCAMASIRLERLVCGAEARVLAIVTPGRRMVVRDLDRLSLRQREIVGYAAAGSTLAEIARSLELSPHTVKYHLKGAYETLGVASRVELLALLRAPG